LYPTFANFPLISSNLRVFYKLYAFFISPYFDHDAFLHHTMHALDVPDPCAIASVGYHYIIYVYSLNDVSCFDGALVNGAIDTS